MIQTLLLTFQMLLPAAFGLDTADLRSGDLLLESLPCQLCSLIEVEEGAPYSHGAVILRENNQLWALQALRRVERIPLQDFLNLRRPGTPAGVFRPIGLPIADSALRDRFQQYFDGLSYDEEFLWNNFDSKGEKLYCSEFITKLLNPFLSFPIKTKPMHYTHSRADWIRYFKGNPPDGMPGVSPGDLSRSPSFRPIGTL